MFSEARRPKQTFISLIPQTSRQSTKPGRRSSQPILPLVSLRLSLLTSRLMASDWRSSSSLSTLRGLSKRRPSLRKRHPFRWDPYPRPSRQGRTSSSLPSWPRTIYKGYLRRHSRTPTSRSTAQASSDRSSTSTRMWRAICKAAGTRPENLVRRRAAHTDLHEMAAAEEVWYKHLGDRLPPTTFYRAKSPLTVPACTVQYDLTAVITD